MALLESRSNPLNLFDGLAQGAMRFLQIEISLQAEPKRSLVPSTAASPRTWRIPPLYSQA